MFGCKLGNAVGNAVVGNAVGNADVNVVGKEDRIVDGSEEVPAEGMWDGAGVGPILGLDFGLSVLMVGCPVGLLV